MASKDRLHDKDKLFMQKAIEEAEKALAIDEVPVGAVVVLENKIIGRGYNLKEKGADPTLHAEITALKEAAAYISDWRLSECQLYVTLEPCSMCAGAMLQARIKRLIFGASDKKAEACGSLYNLVQDERFNHQIEIKEGVLADRCGQLLKDFFKKLRSSKTD